MRGTIAITLSLLVLGLMAAGAVLGAWAVKHRPPKYLTGAQGGALPFQFIVDADKDTAYNPTTNRFTLSGKIKNISGGEQQIVVYLVTDSDLVTSTKILRRNVFDLYAGATRSFNFSYILDDRWEEENCKPVTDFARLDWSFTNTPRQPTDVFYNLATDTCHEPTPIPTSSITPTTTGTPVPTTSPTPATGAKFCCVRDTDPPKCDSFPAAATCAGGNYSCGGNDLKCQPEITSLSPKKGQIGTTITIHGTYLGNSAGTRGKVIWDKIGPDEGLGGCKNKQLPARWIDATKIEAEIDDMLTSCKGKTGKVFVTTDWGNTVEAGTFKITEGTAPTVTPTPSLTPTAGSTVTPSPTPTPASALISGTIEAHYPDDAIQSMVVVLNKCLLADCSSISKVQDLIFNTPTASGKHHYTYTYSSIPLSTDNKYELYAYAWNAADGKDTVVAVAEVTACEEGTSVDNVCKGIVPPGKASFKVNLLAAGADINSDGVYSLQEWRMLVSRFGQVIDTAEGARLVTLTTITDFLTAWQQQEGL